MNKSLKLLFFVALISFINLQPNDASAQITQIKSTKLPAQARSLIKTTWNGAPIVDAWRNKEGRRIEYKASVEDGSTIKFDAAGRWIEVKSYSGVPTKLLPANLVKYINTYYDGQLIVWAVKKARCYQVQLTDGSKLEFSLKGVFQAFL